MELCTGRGVRVLCTTECDRVLLRTKDTAAAYEEDIITELASARLIIADPLFRPICPQNVRFAALPVEAFSGRIYRDTIPDLVSEFHHFVNEVL